MPRSAPGMSSLVSTIMRRFAPVLALLVVPAAVVGQEPPKNLQVLPEDIPRAQLTQVMRSFTAALGVRCSSCHVGEEGQPLSTYDFASDDKAMKVKARAMLQMSMAINNTYLAELPRRREPGVRVSCITCHRGVRRPQAIEAIVQRIVAEDGVAAAMERYRQLRERHYGGFAYDFTDRPLAFMAAELGQDQPEAAMAILEMNLEFHPESGFTLFGLAQLHDAGGDSAKAIEFYRKGLEVMPGNRQAAERLRELTGGA